MTHEASPEFWQAYNSLEPGVRKLADKSFATIKRDPQHPSLRFKKVGPYWSARVGLHHRAPAIESGTGVIWFWIGDHETYDRLISR